MTDHRRDILEMLSKGQITADEAERLLAALDRPEEPGGESTPPKRPRFLRIQVEATAPHRDTPVRVNVRAPMQLLRAGVRLASLIPPQARDHVNRALHVRGVHVDLAHINPENLEEIIEQLDDTTIDVNEKDVKVRLFCE